MLKLPPHEIIEEVSEELRLSSATIEKDFYVTQIIHALKDVSNEHFKLIFMGGTCLSKAHHVVQRMSEDVDYKIEPFSARSLNSKSARQDLSDFRKQILDTLFEKTGLFPEPHQIRKGNNNTFTQMFINYPSVYPSNTVLRPDIKLEFTALPSFLPFKKLPVTSLIQEVLQQEFQKDIPVIECISVDETVSEKWMALCKRIARSERDEKPADKWIVRHLYDLHCIHKKEAVSNNFEQLIPALLSRDRERSKGSDPLFFENTLEQLNQGFSYLKTLDKWESHYNEFVNNMVFQEEPPSYQEAIQTLESLHARAIESISQSPLLKEMTAQTANISSTLAIKQTWQAKIHDYFTSQEKQTALVLAHYDARDGADSEKALQAKNAAFQHMEQLKNKGRELYQDPEIQSLIKNMPYATSTLSLAQSKEQWLQNPDAIELISPVLTLIRQEGLKAESAQSINQTLKQSGGRKR